MNWIKKIFNINKVKENQNDYCSLFYRYQSLQDDIYYLLNENNRLRKELSNALTKKEIEKFKWINVNDDLPDDDVEVLVYCKNLDYMNQSKDKFYISVSSFNRSYGWSQQRTYGHIYYWMPLPEEPKDD